MKLNYGEQIPIFENKKRAARRIPRPLGAISVLKGRLGEQYKMIKKFPFQQHLEKKLYWNGNIVLNEVE